MKTFTVQMLRKSEGIGQFPEKIIVQNVNWPRQCPCCGNSIEGNYHYHLEHKPALGDGLTAYLSWTIPTCRRCAFHFNFDKVVLILLWIFPPLLWVISGYLLFLAYGDNVAAIIFWIIFLVVLGAISYFLRKLSRVFIKATIMQKRCCSISFPITVSSKYPDLSFHVKDDNYAEKLELANS